MLEFISRPWPWFVAGPLIGLFVPLLWLLGRRSLGISANLRHLCAALLPGRIALFQYDWRRSGAWNLLFVLGIAIGGLLGVQLLGAGRVAIAPATRATLSALGVSGFSGLVPRDLISWHALTTF
jgi:hypothetical protein